jgi:phosphoglycerate dehydrogenase-like enzyme
VPVTFKLGITRDVLDAKGAPSFGERALEVLKANPALQWEYLAEPVREITPEIAARYDALYVNSPKVSAESIGRADCRVRIVARHGVGFDSVDVSALTRKGIVLTNTPVAVRRPVAVAALTMIFALAGRLFVKDRITRANRWNDRTSHMGLGLTTRTLAVVGVGSIGKEILRLAQPFGLRMFGVDPVTSDATIASLGASRVSLDEALKQADFVVMSCQLDAGSHHLISTPQMALMKREAFLINLARGPVVDESALIDALKRGVIAGAGLDVFEQEPVAGDNPLLGMDNVIVTPHSLCWTDECFHDIASAALQSVVDFSLGKQPVHLVNPAAFRNP